jgi:hypothetical protein
MTDRKFILDNFAYRTSLMFPTESVNIGIGCDYPKIVVVHRGHATVDRDAISGALNRFELLPEAYRVPAQILNMERVPLQDQPTKSKINQYLLLELLGILQPLLVVCAGEQAVQSINTTNKKPSTFIGKTFQLEQLTSSKVCGIIDPETYSFARATSEIKEHGRQQWQAVTSLLQKLKTQNEKQ